MSLDIGLLTKAIDTLFSVANWLCTQATRADNR